MVSASNDISLRCVSDYGQYLEIEEDGEFISGEYINEENLMILDYKILSGFTEIKNCKPTSYWLLRHFPSF